MYVCVCVHVCVCMCVRACMCVHAAPDILEWRDDYGARASHYAADKGHDHVLELLYSEVVCVCVCVCVKHEGARLQGKVEPGTLVFQVKVT
jgi:hypothetical protein